MPPLLRQEINQTYEAKIFNVSKEDPTYEARKKYLERKKEEDLDAVSIFEKSKKIKKRKLKTIEEKILECSNLRKTKMTMEFNNDESASIKPFAVKKKNVIRATTRFMSGKLLMFTKLSLKCFIYELSEILPFPDESVKKIYKKYKIERIICYHTLTDTDSTALQFVILSDPCSDFPESKIRDVIREIIVKTKILKRFSTSHPFWDKFNARKPQRQKKRGLYEVESIDNPCYATLAVNAKEYFELFKDYMTNKKHKGIKKGSKGMEFANHANRIKPLRNFDTFEKPINEYEKVGRFMAKKEKW